MHRISNAIMAVITALFILSFAVTATLMFRPLYYRDIARLEIAEQSGYPEAEIRENYDALIDYNLSLKESTLHFPTLEMSEAGREHFREVRAIFQFFLRMFLVTAAAGAVGMALKKRRGEYGYLKAAGCLTLGFPLALGAVIAVNWDAAFVMFHELMFDNDYWIFDPATDPVITILPDAFFLHCAVLILLLIFVGAAACFFGYYRGKRKSIA